MSGSAVLSPDGVYRYRLTRDLEADPAAGRDVVFVMLNPSTADATVDDPTIRRCRGFAQREHAGRLTVVNLFAYRATRPAKLLDADDPVGPDNDRHLRDALELGAFDGRVVVAWGAHAQAKARALELRAMAEELGVELYALGLTADGSPRHPLYVRGDAPLIPYRRPSA